MKLNLIRFEKDHPELQLKYLGQFGITIEYSPEECTRLLQTDKYWEFVEEQMADLKSQEIKDEEKI